jgi:hypothetical protein
VEARTCLRVTTAFCAANVFADLDGARHAGAIQTGVSNGACIAVAARHPTCQVGIETQACSHVCGGLNVPHHQETGHTRTRKDAMQSSAQTTTIDCSESSKQLHANTFVCVFATQLLRSLSQPLGLNSPPLPLVGKHAVRWIARALPCWADQVVPLHTAEVMVAQVKLRYCLLRTA